MNLIVFIIFSVIVHFLHLKYPKIPFFIIGIISLVVSFFVKDMPILSGILWGIVAGSLWGNSINKKL